MNEIGRPTEAEITPPSDSIFIGDTLTVFSEFSNHPYDFNSGKNVDYTGNASIGTTFGVYVLKPGSMNFGAAIDSFRFIPVTGRVETGPGADRVKQVYWSETSGKYTLLFRLVALKKGIYAFGL